MNAIAFPRSLKPSKNFCKINGARDVHYNDLDDNEAERWSQLLRPISMRAFDSLGLPAAWAEPEFRESLYLYGV